MQRKRGGNNWIGFVIFLAIVVGPPIARALSGAIFQATGVMVDPDIIIGGIIILAVVASVGGSIVRSVGRMSGGGETRLPTTAAAPPPTMSAPPRPSAPPPTISGPATQPTKLPGAPQFDPIIDPRILAFGIAGLILFGGAFFVILALAGGI